MTQADRYPAQVFWSDEDDGFIALAADLPGCSAFGASREEALAELSSAILAWVQAAETAGNPIPAPSRPAERPDYSGKLLLRMPKELHASLAQSASREGVSLNQYVVYKLALSHVNYPTKVNPRPASIIPAEVERRPSEERSLIDCSVILNSWSSAFARSSCVFMDNFHFGKSTSLNSVVTHVRRFNLEADTVAGTSHGEFIATKPKLRRRVRENG